MSELLGVSLSRGARVGSNLRGGASGGGWLYALPRLDHGLVVCLGTPSAPTRRALARSADRLVVFPHAGSLAGLGRRLVQRGEGERRPDAEGGRRPAGPGAWCDEDGAIDLLVVTSSGRRRWPGAAEHLCGHLAAAGVVYAEGRADLAATCGPATLPLRISPVVGEARTVVPADDRVLAPHLRQAGLDGTVMRRPKLARWERRVLPAAVRRQSRRAWVHLDGAFADDPPAYVRDLAAAAGTDLRGWQWAVAARGDHDSQKVLVLLAPAGERAPTGVAKVTRGAEHASRLDNERRALERLALLPVAEHRVPRPWFSGTHAHRFVLGQSAVAGRPFGEVASWRDGDPALTDALDWLARLGEATRRPVPAGAVAGVLSTLVDRWATVFSPPSGELAALRALMAPMGALDGHVPSVLQHGDPGTWNLLVDAAGRTVFLDWESAELDGLPLWDLLYLARSYAITQGRREGVRDRVEASARHLVGHGTALGARVDAAVAEHVRRLGIPAPAVRPLVLGCWVHRAVKEADRLTPARVQRSESHALLRRLVAAAEQDDAKGGEQC